MAHLTADLPNETKTHVGCGDVRPSRRGRWRAIVLIVVHLAFAAHMLHWKLSGDATLTALEPSEAGETLTTGAINAGFVFFLLLILSTLVLGRWFCGWGCHVVALQDACSWLLRKLGIARQPIRSRFLAFVPLYAAFDMFFLPSILQAIYGAEVPSWTWHLTTTDFWQRFPGPVVTVVTFLVCGFLIVWLLGNKGFCTYACPYGAFFGVADRVAPGRIRVTDACEGCGHCTATCTSNVRVHEEVAKFGQVVDAGCMKCLDCVDVCPKDALYFGFGALPGGAVRASGKRPKRRFDFSLGEELAMGALFIAGVWTFRGLYHTIPFLLALASAVLMAIGVITLVRLARSSDLRFQTARLKSGGRLTGRGAVVLVAILVAVGLTLHSAWIQYHDKQGERLAFDAGQVSFADPTRSAMFAEALPHLERARDHGLLVPAELSMRLGQVYNEVGRKPEATAAFERAIADGLDGATPRVYLARLRLDEQRVDEAVELLFEAFAENPADPYLERLAGSIVRARPDHTRAIELIRAIEQREE